MHMPQCIAAPSMFATGIGGLAVKGEGEDHQGPGSAGNNSKRLNRGPGGWVEKSCGALGPPLSSIISAGSWGFSGPLRL